MALVPALPVRVRFRREAVPGPMARWQPWRWVLVGVTPDDDPVPPAVNTPWGLEASGPGSDETQADWVFRGLEVGLYKDDAEGLYLNATTERPCFWVMWRLQEHDGEAEPRAVPLEVTLSYHDAGRWLDAQEQVDRVDAPAEVVAWLREFTDSHYQPEPKRRQRPQSFQPLTDRFGNPASVSGDPAQRRQRGGRDGG